MKIDWTISVGNVLTALMLLAGLIAAHVQNSKKLQEIDTKVRLMFEWFQHRVIKGNRL